MSRQYSVIVITTKLTEGIMEKSIDKLDEILSELDYEMECSDTNVSYKTMKENGIWWQGETTLYAGESIEEAHKKIEEKIKEINPKAKVQTKWLDLEEPPRDIIGKDIDEEE